jgi:hypothetical protein
VVSALIATAFAQEDEGAAKTQWHKVADKRRPTLPKDAADTGDRLRAPSAGAGRAERSAAASVGGQGSVGPPFVAAEDARLFLRPSIARGRSVRLSHAVAGPTLIGRLVREELFIFLEEISRGHVLLVALKIWTQHDLVLRDFQPQ